MASLADVRCWSDIALTTTGFVSTFQINRLFSIIRIPDSKERVAASKWLPAMAGVFCCQSPGVPNMFEAFYRLAADPFRLLPDAEICFPHRSCANAAAQLQYAVQRGEGIVVVTGPPGSGKTTLGQRLIDDLNVAKVVGVQLVAGYLDATELLRRFAYALDIPAGAMDHPALTFHIERYLRALERSQRRALVLVDEAQTLTPQALEALRLLTDLQAHAQPLMQLVLLGQEGLEDVMGAPGMEQFRQRVIVCCRLRPMVVAETKAYLEYRLNLAGWSGDPSVTGSAVWAIHRHSHGLPRHVNKIGSRLLLYGCSEEKHQLTGRDVQVVIDDLRDELLAAETGAATAGRDYATDDMLDPAYELALVPAARETPFIKVRAARPAIDRPAELQPGETDHRAEAPPAPQYGRRLSSVRHGRQRGLAGRVRNLWSGLWQWVAAIRSKVLVQSKRLWQQTARRDGAASNALRDWLAHGRSLLSRRSDLIVRMKAPMTAALGLLRSPRVGHRMIVGALLVVGAGGVFWVAGQGGEPVATARTLVNASPVDDGLDARRGGAESPGLTPGAGVVTATAQGLPPSSSPDPDASVSAIAAALPVIGDAAGSASDLPGAPGALPEPRPDDVLTDVADIDAHEGMGSGGSMAAMEPSATASAAEVAGSGSTGREMSRSVPAAMDPAPLDDVPGGMPSTVTDPGPWVGPSTAAALQASPPPHPAVHALPGGTDNPVSAVGEDAAGAVMLAGTGDAAGPLPVAADDSPAVERETELARLLASAETAIHRDRLLLPKDLSAYHFLQQALALQPGNATAEAGLQRILQRYIDLAKRALAEDRLKAAQRFVDRAMRVDPADPRIPALSSDVEFAANQSMVLAAAEVDPGVDTPVDPGAITKESPPVDRRSSLDRFMEQVDGI